MGKAEPRRSQSRLTAVWDEWEEWTRARIQEWMQQMPVEEVTEVLRRTKHQRRGADMRDVGMATASRGA